MSATGAPDPGEWRLVFEDTFNGDSLDTEIWETGFGWGNNADYANSTTRDDAVYVEDGTLHLELQQDDDGSTYHGAVHSKGAREYGPGTFFEVKWKGVDLPGCNQAFWSKPATERWPPEIDFFEVPTNSPDQSIHYVHYDGSGGVGGNHQRANNDSHTLSSGTFADDFHVFGCEWRDDGITHYVDGERKGTITNETALESCATGAPFYMMLDVVDHNDESFTGTTPSDGWGEYTTTAEIEWVRIWEYDPEASDDQGPGQDTGEDSLSDGSSGEDSVTGGGGAPSFETIDVGFDDIPENLEPPAPKITVDAHATKDTIKQLNALRDRDEPFPVAIGEFTREDVGITDLTWEYAGDRSGYDVTITLQEHREVYVQAPDLSGGEDQEDSGEADEDASDYIEDSDQFDQIPDPDTENTVNLGDEGLADGDDIDSYLDEHLDSGTRVEVPNGTYTWNGGGLSGSYENAELTGVEGASDTDDGSDSGDDTTTETQTIGTQSHAEHVTLELGDGASADIEVTGGGGGSFHLENIIFSGQASAGNHVLSIGVSDGAASALLRRVWLPNGGAGEQTAGIRIRDNNTGTVYLRNCSVESFPNGGVMARDSGDVVLEGGLYRNNNVADIAFGSDNSKAELVTVVNDEQAPAYQDGQRAQRGLWFTGGDGALATNCDFYHGVDTGTAIKADDGNMTGRVENSRITNDSERPAAIIRSDITFEGVHLTGSGTLNVTGAEVACAGDDCDAADYSTNASDEEVEMDEVVLDADETRTVEVGDNETLEGKVYDQSADGAAVQIAAHGSSWTVRNIAIIGEAGPNAPRSSVFTTVSPGSTATIENCYLPDGGPASESVAGIHVGETHGGQLTIRNCNIQGFPALGIRAHDAGADTGNDGSVEIDTCYVAHNGGANVSMGVNGSQLVNSVVYGDGTGPSQSGEYRGVWGWYQDTEVSESDIFTAQEAGRAVVGGRHGGTVTIINGNLRGSTTGSVVTSNVGGDPDSAPPSSVPTSPAQAADTSGSSGDGSN